MNNLYKTIEKNNLFKLILGLGNKSLENIKKYCAIYSKAGVDMFDLTPDKDVFQAVYEGIKSQDLDIDDFLFCISVAINDDMHGKKAYIVQKECVKCLKCLKQCPHGAIILDKKVTVIQDKCIGCQKCHCSAIKYKRPKSDAIQAIKSVLGYKIDCIEVHISGAKAKDSLLFFKKIRQKFPNIPVGVCVSRENFSNKKLEKFIKQLEELSGENKLILQADGVSMSGQKDSYASTLQAVAMAQIFEKSDIYIILSGGCNSKTKELAKICDVKISGIAIGSYGRILLLEEVNNSEFWYNEKVFNSALKKAQELVNSVKANS